LLPTSTQESQTCRIALRPPIVVGAGRIVGMIVVVVIVGSGGGGGGDVYLTVAIRATVICTVRGRPKTMIVAPELPLAVANALLGFIGTSSRELGIVGTIATPTIVAVLLPLSATSTTVVSNTTLLVIAVIVVGTVTLIVIASASLNVPVGIIVVVTVRVTNTAISFHVARFSALVACSTKECGLLALAILDRPLSFRQSCIEVFNWMMEHVLHRCLSDSKPMIIINHLNELIIGHR